MTPVANGVRDALQAAGLGDWNPACRWLDETSEHVVVLTSPDYNPAAKPPQGRLFVARASTEADAVQAAIAKATAALRQGLSPIGAATVAGTAGGRC